MTDKHSRITQHVSLFPYNRAMDPLAIYVHVPFCVKKCSYCDFNAFSGATERQVQEFVSAVSGEIGQSPYTGQSVPTIFFGGGTPTYLTGGQISSILSLIRDRFQVEADAEISSEANPSTVDAS